MKDLSQILAELANHGSWEGYGLLHYAIEEAIKTQPMPSSMDRLCRELVDVCGKQNPETIYRSIARAVDDIWANPKSRPLLKEYYHRELVEKLTLRQAIDALPERERMVILLRFYKNLTQDRVSKVLGVSQVQVSRIERRAVAKLREALTE